MRPHLGVLNIEVRTFFLFNRIPPPKALRIVEKASPKMCASFFFCAMLDTGRGGVL